MPKSRSSLQDLRLHNPRLSRVGVELLTLGELRRRAGAQLLSSPQRVDFHHLLFVQHGSTKHMVDFVEHELRPGSVLFVRPGQVQQWRMLDGFDGSLALISSEALAPSVARSDLDMRVLSLPEWPAVSEPSRDLFEEALDGMTRLSVDIQRFEGSDLEVGITRHELLALLLRLARELSAVRSAPESSRGAEIYALFVKDLESGYAKRLSVLDYAKRLGFSASTLSRASVSVVGYTAKEVVDRRATVEAKRLLVHSQSTIVQIRYQLGFTEPTNFVKFFRRNMGCTPLEFRERHVVE